MLTHYILGLYSLVNKVVVFLFKGTGSSVTKRKSRGAIERRSDRN